MRVCIHTTLYDSKIQASTSSYSYSVYNMYMVMYEFVSILRARKKTRNFGISEHMMISPNLCGLQKSVTG